MAPNAGFFTVNCDIFGSVEIRTGQLKIDHTYKKEKRRSCIAHFHIRRSKIHYSPTSSIKWFTSSWRISALQFKRVPTLGVVRPGEENH